MKALFSRFGGSGLLIGKGKASALNLPEDQSLDNMLDHRSEEIIPNVFVISSYDLQPEYMAPMLYLPSKAHKLGTIVHIFNEISLQYDMEVETDIYVTYHQFTNVYALPIKTHKDGMELIMDKYIETYDYVQTTFFRDAQNENDDNLFYNPKVVELMLHVLFFKMEIYHSPISFTPSRTHLGKHISSQFIDSLDTFYTGINSLEQLSDKLKKQYYPLFSVKHNTTQNEY
jgi:hypothetical protein